MSRSNHIIFEVIEAHNKIIIEERIYLDEIDHVPIYQELQKENQSYIIDLEDFILDNEFPGVFHFFICNNNKKKIITSKSKIVFNEIIKTKYKNFLYSFFFNHNGVLELKVESIGAFDTEVNETSDFVTFYIKDFFIDSPKNSYLIIDYKISSKILNYMGKTKNKIKLEYLNEKNIFRIKKDILLNNVVKYANFDVENPTQEIAIIIDDIVYYINIREKVMLFNPWQFIFKNEKIIIKVWNRYKPIIENVIIDKKIIKLEINSPDETNIDQIKVVPRSSQFNENIKEGFLVNIKNVFERISTIEFSTAQFYEKMGKTPNIIDFFAICTIKKKKIIVRMYLTKKIELANLVVGEVLLIPYKTVVSSLAIKIENVYEMKTATPVAVYGSCYSRLMFSSDEYFNPEYKKDFNVVLTQFHSTTISTTSGSPGYKIIEKYVKNSMLRKQNVEYVKTDFKKDFFEKLRTSGAEYFVFDLYADSSLSMMKWGRNTYTTATYYFKEELKSFLIQEKKSFSLYTHEDTGYLEKWKENINVFILKVSEIIPLEKMILISSKRVYEYRMKNEKIGKINHYLYGKSMKVGEAADFWSEIMEDYILHKYPQINIIDMSKYEYLADLNHPQKLSTNHYESNYYKTLMLELKLAVLKQEKG